MRSNTCYICIMISTIRHKNLRLYFEEGNGAKLPHEQLAKIARILSALDAVSSEDDIRALGSGIHKLTGNMKDFWSIKVSANYRIIFRFEEGDIFDIDYVDYH
jgi:proteic killer suppression protein